MIHRFFNQKYSRCSFLRLLAKVNRIFHRGGRKESFTEKKGHLRRLGWNWKKKVHLSNPKGPKIGKKTPPLRIESENLKVTFGGSLEPRHRKKQLEGRSRILTKWCPGSS